MGRTKKYTKEESFARKRYSLLKSRVDYNMEDIWKIDDFMKWYVNKPKVCAYCKCTEKEVSTFMQVTNSARKEKRGKTLEIERIKPKGKYIEENIVLACHLCNNAKSDFEVGSLFKEHAAPGIGKMIKAVLREKKCQN